MRIRVSRVAIITALTTLCSCEKGPTAPTAVASIAIIASNTTMQVGQTQQLTAVLNSATGDTLTGRVVTWSSSDQSSAIVSSNGIVTALKPSSSTITASVDRKSASVVIAVTAAPIALIELSAKSTAMYSGQSQLLTAILRGSDGQELTGRTVSWVSSDTSVATIPNSVASSVTILAKRRGAVQITAASESRFASVNIEVQPAWVAADSLSLAYPGTFFGYAIVRRPDGSRLIVFSGPEWDRNSWSCAPIPHKAIKVGRIGSVEEVSSLLSQREPYAVHSAKGVSADFNGDGADDVFFGNTGCDNPPFPGETNTLFLSKGLGYEDASLSLPRVLAITHSAAGGDLRRIGRNDIVVIPMSVNSTCQPETGRMIYILRSRTDGNFTCDETAVSDALAMCRGCSSGSEAPFLSVAVADLTGDGALDIVLGGSISKNTQDEKSSRHILLENDGTGQFKGKSHLLPIGAWGAKTIYPAPPVVTDLNGDGRPDLIVEAVENYERSKLQAFINEGAGIFSDQSEKIFPNQRASRGWTEYGHRIELDGGGCEDIILTRGIDLTPNVYVAFKCRGDGTFEHFEPLNQLPANLTAVVPISFAGETILVAVVSPWNRNLPTKVRSYVFR